MIWCVLVLLGNLVALRPEGHLGVTRDLVGRRTGTLGRDEPR